MRIPTDYYLYETDRGKVKSACISHLVNVFPRTNDYIRRSTGIDHSTGF